MRIVGLGDRVQKKLQHIVVVPLFQILYQLIVTFGDNLGTGINRKLVQLLLQQLAFDPIPPKVVGILFVGGPRLFAPVKSDGTSAFESKIFVNQFADLGCAALDSFFERAVNIASGLNISDDQVLVQRTVILLMDFIDVLLGEK